MEETERKISSDRLIIVYVQGYDIMRHIKKENSYPRFDSTASLNRYSCNGSWFTGTEVYMEKVLIVDDDRSVCRCLQELIRWEELGFTAPGIAYHGAEALEQMKESHFDIVISDIKMPVMDGPSLCREIKRFYPETAIIFLSAYEDFATAQLAIKAGVRDYILKPINRESLLTLEATLDRIHSEEKSKKYYADLMTSNDKRSNIFKHLKEADWNFFETFFDDCETKFSEAEEQSQSVCVLLLRELYDFLEHGLGMDYKTVKANHDKNLERLRQFSPKERILFVKERYSNLCGQLEREITDNELLIGEVREFIEKNYGNSELGVSGIARNFGYNADYLGRVFASQTGTTISNYLLETRLKQAGILLKDTWIPINDIAKMVGYSNSNYFAKVFRSKHKMSPSDYRNMLLKAKDSNREEGL